MNADKLLFRILFYVACNTTTYYLLFSDFITLPFIQGYIFLLTGFLLSIGLERLFGGKEFYMQLPLGNIIFSALAIYLPVPFIYDNLLIKTLSLWSDDNTILKALFITNLGIHCVLTGYHAVKLFPPVQNNYTFRIEPQRIYQLFIVYLLSIFILIITGNYGFTIQHDESDLSYVTILNNLSQFGIFGLTAFVYYYPWEKKRIYFFTAIMSILGLLSGFKESAIQPMIVVGVTYFFINKKIPWKLVFIGSIAIILIFSVVTSFRNAYMAGGRKEIASVGQLTSTYIKSTQEGSKSKYNHFDMDIAESILYRLNYAPAIGKVISYTEKKKFGLPPDSHPIHILGTPVYFIMPRFILPFKPMADFGNYVTREIYGYRKAKYSIGVSQPGYSYLWKGILGIVLLMTFVGVFQGFLHHYFYISFPPIYIYLFISNIYTYDAIWAYTVSFFRFAFIFLVVLLLLGRRIPKSKQQIQFSTE